MEIVRERRDESRNGREQPKACDETRRGDQPTDRQRNRLQFELRLEVHAAALCLHLSRRWIGERVAFFTLLRVADVAALFV